MISGEANGTLSMTLVPSENSALGGTVKCLPGTQPHLLGSRPPAASNTTH